MFHFVSVLSCPPNIYSLLNPALELMRLTLKLTLELRKGQEVENLYGNLIRDALLKLLLFSFLYID